MVNLTVAEKENFEKLKQECADKRVLLALTLDRITKEVCKVNADIEERMGNLTKNMIDIATKSNILHTSNLQVMNKLHEELHEIDGFEMEANRAFSDIRNQVAMERRRNKGHGLIRKVFYFVLSLLVSLLVALRLMKRVEQPKKVKKVKAKVPVTIMTPPKDSAEKGFPAFYYKDPSNNIFCIRNKLSLSSNLTYQVSSTSRSFNDPRFMCSNGDMSWYRGRRNIDHLDKPCLFWSTVTNKTSDISDGSSSSYSMKRILPDEYENFCRNPDKNPLGPWCYVINNQTTTPLKSPCFQPCKDTVTLSAFSCLNLNGFPYLKEHYDMSDLLDLFQLIQTFNNVHLMYESRYVVKAKVERRLTKTCINTGHIAAAYGPWIAVFGDVAKKFYSVVGRKKLRDLCAPLPSDGEIQDTRTDMIREAIFEDELTVADCSFWRRCFTACQHNMISCWNKNDTDGYYGLKELTREMEKCIPWALAAAEIVKAAEVKEWRKMEYHYMYYQMLLNDTKGTFVKNRLFLNTENACIQMEMRNISDIDIMIRGLNITKLEEENWRMEFQNMYESGPGCFVKKNQTMIRYQPCFNSCQRNVTIEAKDFTKELCLVEKEHRYGICRPVRIRWKEWKELIWFRRGIVII